MKTLPFKILGLLLISIQQAHANYSLLDAQTQLLDNNPAIQAAQTLYQAEILQAKSVENIHHPNISINLHAFNLNQNSSIPLDNIKEQTAKHIDTHLEQHLSGVPSGIKDTLQASVNQAIFDIPNHQDIKLRHHGITPSINAVMPIYTGGMIQSTKNLANLKAQHGEFQLQEQISLAKLNLIHHYFNVQLQKQLTTSQQNTLKAMQLHVDNAYKLEEQGFISKGQRMQFEVARNQTQRLYQTTHNQLQNSVYELTSLLGLSQLEQLSTPLFINTKHQPNWQELTHHLRSSALNQKLDTDIQIANENIALKQSAKKPKVVGVARYTLDEKPDWFIGLAVQHNLYSGINRDQQIQAAYLQKQAALASKDQINQKLMTVMQTAYTEMQLAQNTHALLAKNRQAAEENLRIQNLSFKEGFGTVANVVDAQTSLSQINGETALNAYRYVLSLATLLHHAGMIDDFYNYLNLSDVHYIE